MQQLYHVEGILNKGFVGQITYMVCLEKPCDKLDIEFTFDKQRYTPEDVTDEFVAEIMDVCRREYGYSPDEARIRESILGEMKTEIHTLAMLNDEFIGCVHKQLLNRHMTYDGDFASEGCIPQKRFEGVLKVTVLVFNVIKDNTHYMLTVRGE